MTRSRCTVPVPAALSAATALSAKSSVGVVQWATHAPRKATASPRSEATA